MDELNLDLRGGETDKLEFKSSSTSTKEFGTKLCAAASAFSNSGGGIILYGLNDEGEADGGVDVNVGRTCISDWVDQMLSNVQPQVSYKTSFLADSSFKGDIPSEKRVVAIEFYKSFRLPHMAPDNKYYIRAGAHTQPASAFIVEALWSMRKSDKPQLAARLQYKASNDKVAQLVVVSLTSSAALNITLNFSPLPPFYSSNSEHFPLKIPFIDQQHPFIVDVCHAKTIEQGCFRHLDVEVAYNVSVSPSTGQSLSQLCSTEAACQVAPPVC